MADLAAWARIVRDVAIGARNASIVCMGDSLTSGQESTGAGLGSNAHSASYPTVMAGLITSAPASANTWLGVNGAYAAGGTDVFAYDTRLTKSGTWTDSYTGYTINTLSGAMLQGPATGTLTFTPNVTFDRIEIQHVRFSGNAEYTVNIGGSTLATLDMDGATGVITTAPISATSGNNPVNIVSTGAGSWVCGTRVYRSTVKEISIFNAGVSGLSAAQASTDSTFTDVLPMLRGMAPDLTIIMLNTNDQSLGTSEASYKASMGALITAAQQSGSVLLVIPPYFNPTLASEASQDTWGGYVTDLGVTYNAPVFSMKAQSGWTSYATANGNGYMAADGVHMSSTGYAAMAARIRSAIDVRAPSAAMLSLGAG